MKLSDKDKLYEYMRLDATQTGLDNEILVDDCGSYKRDRHPLLIFVSNDEKEYIPISVERNPQILDNDVRIKIPLTDIEKIKLFIIMNMELLRAFANEEIDAIEFLHSLIKE